MPNFTKHVSVGAGVGGGADLVWQLARIFDSPVPPNGFWETIKRIDFVELALFAFGGAAVAALPDMMEPATSPNHRAFFHSVCFGGAVTYGAFGKHTRNWSPEDRVAARTAALCYLSHLALDLCTPKELPII